MTNLAIKYNPEARQNIINDIEAQIELCYTCNSCASECPMNVATNRLRPLKIVRMANMGMIEELAKLPEVWYCLQCNRCKEVCPMTVKPSYLIKYVRQISSFAKIVSTEFLEEYKKICDKFHRVRWHLASACLNNLSISDFGKNWHKWAETPIEHLDEDKVFLLKSSNNSKNFKNVINSHMGYPNNLSTCFTCLACTCNCPVCYNKPIFDPLKIFRMVNLGQKDILLKSPIIWLCLGCQNCTNVCTQDVRGHLIIHNLQEMAIHEGIVDKNIRYCMEKAHAEIYLRFTEEVDSLFKY
ncbi:MAG: 4Fe-4S dicluster domain-containing protein [Desulfobacterales bacterium]|nr:4Fe-4S dicluster domain-containing protein [Desulfobacterales bacterium]